MKHKKTSVIRAWKDPEYRESLSKEQCASIPANPAGDYELDPEVLENTVGGVFFTWLFPLIAGSEGLFCTISGECTPGGESCNPLYQ
jgi:mersacidin/lichenicidin family type 2 lantibiotic